MILTGFDLYRYTLPLTGPLPLRGVVVSAREGVLVRLRSLSGAEGWGEAAPLPGFSRETLEEAEQQLRALRSTLKGWVVTGDWTALDGALAHQLDEQKPAPSVRFGLELAAWSLYAATQGKTLPEAVAPQPRATVSLNGLLTGAPDEVLRRAERLRADGFRAVKLKVGRRALAEEIDLVCALRRTLGPNVGIRLDANRAWTFEEAAAFSRGVLGAFVEYIEEPLADPSRLAELATRYDAPVALDESLVDLPAAALVDHTYARAVVLKPTLLGGLVPTLRLARRAASLGMTPVVSAAFETGLGLRGLVALAAGLPDVPAGLDTYRWLAEDVITPPLDLQGGQIDVPAMTTPTPVVREAALCPI